MSVTRVLNSICKQGVRETGEDMLFHLCCTSCISNSLSVDLYDDISKFYFRHRFAKRINTVSRLDPIKIVPVNPDQIINFSRRSFPNSDNMRRDLGKIKGGDWDIRETAPTDRFEHRREYFDNFGQFNESIFYESIKHHFSEEVPWTNTEYIQRFLEYEDLNYEAVLRKYQAIDNLYQTIRNKGYRRQGQVHTNICWIQRLTDEISIDIGRNGELLFVDGKHRLAIAKILGLDTVPVSIIVRHKQWLKCRDDLAATASEPSHPDLVEVTGGQYWVP